MNEVKAPKNFLISPHGAELDEARKLLLTCAAVAIRANIQNSDGKIADFLTENEYKKLLSNVFKTNLNQCYRRIAALQEHAPEIIINALRLTGYGISVDQRGQISIDPENSQGFGAAGSAVTYEQFMKTFDAANDA